MDKTQALRDNKGKFDNPMRISSAACTDLNWWGCNLEGSPTGGCWTPTEAENHINYLDTKAVLFGLQSFCSKIAGHSINILIDNTTAVACLNVMGTCHSPSINTLVIEIWEWCIKHNVWLTASHIAGKDNIVADSESQKTRQETEWSLNPSIFSKAVKVIGLEPEIYLFAIELTLNVTNMYHISLTLGHLQ